MSLAHCACAVPTTAPGIAPWDQVGEFRTKALRAGMGSWDRTPWYREWADRCQPRGRGSAGPRVARCLHVERHAGQWVFVFEDLDGAGFDQRHDYPSGHRLESCLRWLAAFHATFIGTRPKGLWKVGTYWHLKTRPDEHHAMAEGALRDAASAIDRRLGAARFKTLVHGDAKPANFCFSHNGSSVAAVDFQYVGGGPGIKDVAYLLAGKDRSTVVRALDVYFAALRQASDTFDANAVESEWRELYPWAWADFHRFLAGWSPGWHFQQHELAMTREVLSVANGR